MITTLFAWAVSSAPGVVDALGLPISTTSFGPRKAFAVLVVAFAFVLGAMFLGGHLGEASRRRRDKRRDKRH